MTPTFTRYDNRVEQKYEIKFVRLELFVSNPLITFRNM